ncbi:MAG: 16S rRNA (uracil(1498)-N(3))-methyltransferase [Clostridia bacterium]|nr:16S rRNA (uracil(1498)-N(3))-methyltransferase [Clostridia bacterium]
MPRFFIRQNQVEERDGQSIVRILGDDAHHIARALRMAVGERIEVCDMQKNLYQCTILEFFDDKEVLARVDSRSSCDTEPSYQVILYQALAKGDKMETIIQKAVECGATKIVPFKSERCVVKIDKKDEPKKIDRWQKIAEAGAKQSGRGIIPEVGSVLTFDQMVSEAGKSSLPLFCYEAEDGATIKTALKVAKDKSTISLIIGSEGGFSVDEADKIKNAGIKSVGLGKRILRCETASTFALSCIVYENEL